LTDGPLPRERLSFANFLLSGDVCLSTPAILSGLDSPLIIISAAVLAPSRASDGTKPNLFVLFNTSVTLNLAAAPSFEVPLKSYVVNFLLWSNSSCGMLFVPDPYSTFDSLRFACLSFLLAFNTLYGDFCLS
jgi:hypothetical protein